MRIQSKGHAGVVSQPLYAQVRERLLERIVSKEWQQGQPLPNEFDLARQFGVSIGTIRKAVEGLEVAKMVVRRQGRGTFVARQSFPLPTEPVSVCATAADGTGSAHIATLSFEHRCATPEEQAALAIGLDSQVIAIERHRTFPGEARSLDRICLPQTMFYDLEPSQPLPENLYEFYGDFFGVRVVACAERVTSVSAGDAVARLLGVASNTPLLRLERTATSLSKERVEWRVSYCLLPEGLSFTGAL